MTDLEKVKTAVDKGAQFEAALQDMLTTDNTLLFELGVDALDETRKAVQRLKRIENYLSMSEDDLPF